jgi:hypothetical protein
VSEASSVSSAGLPLTRAQELLGKCRQELVDRRVTRPRPALDDKVSSCTACCTACCTAVVLLVVLRLYCCCAAVQGLGPLLPPCSTAGQSGGLPQQMAGRSTLGSVVPKIVHNAVRTAAGGLHPMVPAAVLILWLSTCRLQLQVVKSVVHVSPASQRCLRFIGEPVTLVTLPPADCCCRL